MLFRSDILLKPNQYLDTGRTSNAQGTQEVLDAYINSLPESEREAALKRITAPLNGKDVADKMMADEKYMPDLDEYRLYRTWKKDQEVDILDSLAKGAEHIFDQAGKAIGESVDHPLNALVKSAPSLVEAFSQGTRNLYGMVAQSRSEEHTSELQSH